MTKPKDRKEKPVFIIAEISANHGHNFNRALELIKKAGDAGADAVKFQTYTADTITIDSRGKHFMIKHPEWGGQSLYELYEKAHTPWEWFKDLKKAADDLEMGFFSTAFDKTAVDFLEELGVPVHKIASFELTDIPLIEYMAKTGKPLIMSTGMATAAEIKDAVAAAEASGAGNITLLKCVSDYPANADEMNLKTIPDMKSRFGCSVGLSDHTLGIGASIAAVSLGAEVIEKHFTLSRKVSTPDSFFSMEPDEFKLLVDNIRIAEKAMGEVVYGATGRQKGSRVFRRSLFVTQDIKKDGLFTEDNVRSIRPGHGLPPKFMKKILGKKAARSISRGTPLSHDHVKS